MSDLVRDAPIGQLIRWLTKNRVLRYPEEKADFTCPMGYQGEKRSPPDLSTHSSKLEREKPSIPAISPAPSPDRR